MSRTMTDDAKFHDADCRYGAALGEIRRLLVRGVHADAAENEQFHAMLRAAYSTPTNEQLREGCLYRMCDDDDADDEINDLTEECDHTDGYEIDILDGRATCDMCGHRWLASDKQMKAQEEALAQGYNPEEQEP